MYPRASNALLISGTDIKAVSVIFKPVDDSNARPALEARENTWLMHILMIVELRELKEYMVIRQFLQGFHLRYCPPPYISFWRGRDMRGATSVIGPFETNRDCADGSLLETWDWAGKSGAGLLAGFPTTPIKSMYGGNLLLIKPGEDCVFLGGPRDMVQGRSRELRVIPRKRLVSKVDDISPGFHDSGMGIKVG